MRIWYLFIIKILLDVSVKRIDEFFSNVKRCFILVRVVKLVILNMNLVVKYKVKILIVIGEIVNNCDRYWEILF